MTWEFSIHPGVWQDADDAIDYYALVDPSLTRGFIDELEAAFSFVKLYPQAGRILVSRYRRIALRRFPYLVCYEITDEAVRVLALIHNRRGPQWVHMHLANRV